MTIIRQRKKKKKKNDRRIKSCSLKDRKRENRPRTKFFLVLLLRRILCFSLFLHRFLSTRLYLLFDSRARRQLLQSHSIIGTASRMIKTLNLNKDPCWSMIKRFSTTNFSFVEEKRRLSLSLSFRWFNFWHFHSFVKNRRKPDSSVISYGWIDIKCDHWWFSHR